MMTHGQGPVLPETPTGAVDILKRPLQRFLRIEAMSGVVLIIATAAALVLANSSYADTYHQLFETPLTLVSIAGFELTYSVHHWINDGLMVIFFFVVGLEIKRELFSGELADPRRAALPMAAAAGGMLVPALIYLSLQAGEPGERGWGIPMATDIAFVVGCMAVMGKRLPHGLRIMMLTLAIVDDIGAIVVIAVGYTANLDLAALMLGFAGFGVCLGLNRIGVRNVAVYTVVGLCIWYAFMQSGVHATVAGVVLGLLTPANQWINNSLFGESIHRFYHFLQGDDDTTDDLERRFGVLGEFTLHARENIPTALRLERFLHPWVAFGIMPLFAFANAGVHFSLQDIVEPVSVAVICGLFIGKPIGITLISWLAVRSGLARLPSRVTWPALFGGGILGGIGFTMALFIGNLALDGDLLNAAKIGILTGSVLSAVVGLGVLVVVLPRSPATTDGG